MPEWPDLQAYATNLEKMASGKKVVGISLYKPKKINAHQAEVGAALTASRIAGFKTNGKTMRIAFTNGKELGIHLMLKGRFDLVSNADGIAGKILALNLGDASLVVSDPRGMAKIELDPPDSPVPEAVSPEFSMKYFLEKLKAKSSKNIKAFLTDQNIVRGIGNAYADEILWEAKVSPESRAGKLPDEVAKTLYASILKVLRRSVDEILRIDPDVIHGEIRPFMRIHNKEKTICPNGYRIRTKKIASKKTYFTDEQVVY